MSFKIIMGLNKITYERLYLKLEMIAANCGGIIKILLLFGEIFTLYFRKLAFKSFIVNYFFNTKSFSLDDDENPSYLPKTNNEVLDRNTNKDKESNINREFMTSQVKLNNNYLDNMKNQENGLGLTKKKTVTVVEPPRMSINSAKRMSLKRLNTHKDLTLARLVKDKRIKK
jgi:hypothetical protein